jgi:hypothetical protein
MRAIDGIFIGSPMAVLATARPFKKNVAVAA